MWNIEAITGYKPITTFWEDFTIAEKFGESAIRDTFRRAFDGWKDNYKYLTELVMVLNWKIWEWMADAPTEEEKYIAKIYDQLWEQADHYACENLQGEELDYFYLTTD